MISGAGTGISAAVLELDLFGGSQVVVVEPGHRPEDVDRQLLS
jgi:hypothetical protein